MTQPSDSQPAGSPAPAPPPEDALVRSKSPEGVRRMFSDIAPSYDFLNHLLSGGVDLWWRRVAARRLVTRDTRRILDVCAGTGDLSLALAARARQIGTTPLILAPDFTPAMTRLAAPKFEKQRTADSGQRIGQGAEDRVQGAGTAEGSGSSPAGEAASATPQPLSPASPSRLSAPDSQPRASAPRLSPASQSPPLSPCTLVADTLRLPFADSAFDLVTVAFGIRNVTDLRGGLREMARVARPGGTVAVLEFSHPRTPAFRWAYDFYFHHVLPRIGRALTGTRAYMYLPKSVASFPDTDEFAALLSEIAGTPAEARRLTFGIATLYSATVKK